MKLDEIILGKYTITKHKSNSSSYTTDNPREALWLANMDPDNTTITNNEPADKELVFNKSTHRWILAKTK